MARFSKTVLALAVLLVICAKLYSATGFHCAYGDPVSASLGDGVIMNTCMWEKEPGKVVRAGPFELVKNGVPILRSQTDKNGKLHGSFTSWNDAGEIIENGNYARGLKQGRWLIVDADGNRATVHYDAGVLIEPRTRP